MAGRDVTAPDRPVVDAPAPDPEPAPPRRRPRPRVPHPPATAVPGLAAAAFGLALLAESVLILTGQWLTPRAWVAWTAWTMWALAAAAFVALVRETGDDVDRRREAEPWRSDADIAHARPTAAGGLRAACALLGLIGGAAAVAMIQAIGDEKPARTYVWILVLWAVAVAIYTLGLALPGAWLRPRLFARSVRRHRRALLDAALLFAVALAMRVVWLDRVPNVLTGDEGVFGLAARWMGQGEGAHMFGTYWANGTLYLVPQALLARVLDAGRLATRLPTAVASAFVAPATYALGRVVASRRVGLLAGLLMAVSHLHVHVSRMGLGHGLDAVFAAVAGAGLVHAVRERDARTAAVAGVALGMAQYGYVGGRLVDVVALAFALLTAGGIALAAWRRGEGRGPSGVSVRRRGWRWWWRAAGIGPLFVACGGALIVAGPMVRWALVRPNDYLSRLSAQGILQTGKWQEVADRVGNGPLAIALSQARDALYAILVAPAYEFYFTPYPMLDVVWASVFGLGFAACLARPADRGRLWLALQIGLAWLMLALGAHASTATYRITGALPAIAVVAALALFALTDALWTAADAEDPPPEPAPDDDRSGAGQPGDRPPSRVTSRRRLPGQWFTPAGLAIGIICFQLWAYWGVFAPGCSFFDKSTAAASLLGETVRSRGDGRAVFVLGRTWFDAGAFDSVRYLADRTVLPFDAVAPPGTRADADPAGRLAHIFDVPADDDPDVLLERVRAAAPALIFAVPERRSELDFLRERLDGSAVEELARCRKAEGALLGVTLIEGGDAAGGPITP